MQKETIKPFDFIGISVSTTNQNNQAARDIGQLWDTFVKENIAAEIPNKLDETVLAVYTNYEGDHTMPYDTIVGCKVSSLDHIPEGLTGYAFDGGTYSKFVSKGDITKGSVYNTWLEIWQQNLDRKYTADFEVYDERSKDLTNAEVDIFISTI
ncbi:GyrI-like domain-containing protein [Aquimarina sp. MMG016]|uniref:GyrI-like domain-containing protein n=1 Tax=Aquimarina sp. MMG016 TaxID=2822690 RepID=UPI001B3A288A|nr:GyrI-like domain-containing protein [Aquimarina sp. MMG016]MBQ4820670.1 AraC family transcriptional regulator [Aquimarina sp. MMG016]